MREERTSLSSQGVGVQTFTSALWRQRQEDLQPRLHSEFQISQGYTVRFHFQKINRSSLCLKDNITSQKSSSQATANPHKGQDDLQQDKTLPILIAVHTTDQAVCIPLSLCDLRPSTLFSCDFSRATITLDPQTLDYSKTGNFC